MTKLQPLWVLAFLFLSALPGCAFADADKVVADHTLLNGDHLLEYRLANGFQVLIVPRHQAKVLTYQTWFHVGSIDEKLDPKLKKTGLAHLFEHMMFRGSDKYPDGKFDELTSRMGATKQNATTYFYRTNYYESIPSDQLDKLMDLESDRMHKLNFTKESFEKEKGAVVGELRRHNDSPQTAASDELFRIAYEVAPFRYTVIGTEPEIKGFTLDEAKYFYKTYYSPNDATLIIIGDVEPAAAMKLVHKHYDDMKAQNVPKLTIPDEPKQKKERRSVITHPQASSEILLLGYHIPAVTAPETVPLSLLGAHLSRGMEARLRKLLVDTGIAVGAEASPSYQPNIFEFFVQLAEGRTSEQALKVLDGEIASLQKKPIPRESFERALNQELLNLSGDITDNSELGNWLGEYLMLSGNYLRGFEIINAYKTIQPADLQRAAKTFLVPENRSVVMLRPQKKGRRR